MIRPARAFAAAAFGLAATGAVTQTALGRPDRHGLADMSMPTLTAILASQTKPGRTRDAAIAALLASTAGDMSDRIDMKIGWYGAAHIAYIAAFHKKADCTRWWPVGVAIVAAGVWASAKSEGLRPACVVYATLVAAMTVTASGYSKLAGISALTFALSDFLIGYGLWRAKKHTRWGRALITGTYLAAQAGLTAAIVKEEGKP